MYKITINYTIPSGGRFGLFNLYTNKPLKDVKENIKDLVISHNMKYGDGIIYGYESIPYAGIHRVKLLKALIYA